MCGAGTAQRERNTELRAMGAAIGCRIDESTPSRLCDAGRRKGPLRIPEYRAGSNKTGCASRDGRGVAQEPYSCNCARLLASLADQVQRVPAAVDAEPHDNLKAAGDQDAPGAVFFRHQRRGGKVDVAGQIPGTRCRGGPSGAGKNIPQRKGRGGFDFEFVQKLARHLDSFQKRIRSVQRRSKGTVLGKNFVPSCSRFIVRRDRVECRAINHIFTGNSLTCTAVFTEEAAIAFSGPCRASEGTKRRPPAPPSDGARTVECSLEEERA